MKIEAIILAAGLSSRAGTNKMKLKIDSLTILERCINAFVDICERIIVVGGYKIEEIQEIVKKYDKVYLVENKDYESGMFSSVKAGISQVKGGRFFLTPGDYPFIEKQLCEKMLQHNDDIIIPVYKESKGHPILINSSLKDQILNYPDCSNLREFINKVGYSTIEAENDRILIDIDTIEDYEAFKKEVKILKYDNI